MLNQNSFLLSSLFSSSVSEKWSLQSFSDKQTSLINLTHAHTHSHVTASFSTLHLKAAEVLYLFLHSCCPCVYFMFHVFCPLWMVTSTGKCLPKGNLSILHSITAENARQTTEKKARGGEHSCDKRVVTTEYRSKSRVGRECRCRETDFVKGQVYSQIQRGTEGRSQKGGNGSIRAGKGRQNRTKKPTQRQQSNLWLFPPQKLFQEPKNFLGYSETLLSFILPGHSSEFGSSVVFSAP